MDRFFKLSIFVFGVFCLITTSNTAFAQLSIPAPFINTQPKDVTALVGDSAVFQVEAEGGGILSYQWYENNSRVGSKTYLPRMWTSVNADKDGYQYHVEVCTGSICVNSEKATLKVLTEGTAPTIHKSLHNTSAYVGETVSFETEAQGPGQLSYYLTQNGTQISPMSSRPNFEIHAKLSNNGFRYAIVAKNRFGSTSTNEARLSVYSKENGPIILKQPNNLAGSEGQTGVFAVLAKGVGALRYTWFINGEELANSNTPKLPYTIGSDSDEHLVKVEICDSNSCTTSNNANVNLGGQFIGPIITKHPTDKTLNINSLGNFQVQAESNSEIKYRWYFDSKPVTDLEANNDIFSIIGNNNLNGSRVSAEVCDITGCNFSTDAILTIEQPEGLPEKISGVITFDGKPLSHVFITSGSQAYTTKADGYFELDTNTLSDRFFISIQKRGYTFKHPGWSNPVKKEDLINETLSNNGFNAEASCSFGYSQRGERCVTNFTEHDGSFSRLETFSATAERDSFDGIQLSWEAVDDSTKYNVYRSQSEGNRGLRITTLTGLEHFDRSAVPGVQYYYTIDALKGDKTIGRSNAASGYRETNSNIVDIDGDGVSDTDEIEIGTDPFDRGSFNSELLSPIFTKYNTFLHQQNYLELVADGEENLNVNLTIYSSIGYPIAYRNINLQGNSQQDVDINEILRWHYRRWFNHSWNYHHYDKIGVVKIEFDENSSTKLRGRMSSYRSDFRGNYHNPTGQYSFAFARELDNPVQGITHSSGNSYDPQGRGNLVPNWLEVINIDSVSRTFTYRIYDQAGQQLFEDNFTVPPLGEIDKEAGHQFGQGVYLIEVLPHDGKTRYHAAVTRYSSNSRFGNFSDTYNFAFPVKARAGTGDRLYAPIRAGQGGCYYISNWIELINVTDDPVSVRMNFRRQNGRLEQTHWQSIQPKSQFHFSTDAAEIANEVGSVEIISGSPDALMAQSAVYYHDCSNYLLQTAFVSPARTASIGSVKGTFNTFLGMDNQMTVISASEFQTLFIDASTNGNVQHSEVAPQRGTSTHVSDLKGKISANNYGLISIDATNTTPAVVAEVVRFREIHGRMDFAMPTLIQ